MQADRWFRRRGLMAIHPALGRAYMGLGLGVAGIGSAAVGARTLGHPAALLFFGVGLSCIVALGLLLSRPRRLQYRALQRPR